MVLTIKKSSLGNEKRLGYVLLACEQYGTWVPKEKLVGEDGRTKGRETQSKLSGCPFALHGREFQKGMWYMRVKCGRHNHHMPTSLVGHAYAARMETKDQSMVKWFSATGSSPKAILEGLRMQKEEDGVEFVSSIRTLYNAKAKMKREALEFRTITQEVLYRLQQRNYFFVSRRSETDDTTLGDLMFAHPDSRHLLRMFPYVILMDTTYKTNR